MLLTTTLVAPEWIQKRSKGEAHREALDFILLSVLNNLMLTAQMQFKCYAIQVAAHKTSTTDNWTVVLWLPEV